MTGAEILLETLLTQGVEVVFGYPGGAILNVYDALYRQGGKIRHVTGSHEQGAAHAADGYARSTGRVGVVFATSGPGATNLVTGLATAYHDSVPMVAVTCNVSRDLLGRDSFQEVNIVEIARPVVKWSRQITDVTRLGETVRQAFEIAASGRKGPVLLDIPKDITAMEAPYHPLPRYRLSPDPLPDPQSLDQAAQLLLRAQRPLIYAGGGVTFSDSSDALKALAERIDAPVCLSMMGLSSLPPDSPYYLGLVGMHGSPAANRAVLNCDVLLTVGARFSDRVTGDRERFAKDAVIIHIDIDPAELSKNVPAAHHLVGDAGVCLRELTRRLPKQERRDWRSAVSGYRKNAPLPNAPAQPEDPATPREILRQLPFYCGHEDIIVTDVGQHQMFTAQYYPFYKPRTFLSSCGLGTMGYGMGAANGAAVGNPDKRVVLVTGDGSFHMNLPELAVAVTQQLPIVVLVMNNHVLGMVHQWQKLFYEERYSQTEIDRKTDYKALGEAFGAQGMRITKVAQIRPVLTAAFAQSGPVVVDCQIPASQRVFPIIPPGKTGHDMIFHD